MVLISLAWAAPEPVTDDFGVFDLDNVVVVRPVDDDVLTEVDLTALDRAIGEALWGRTASYDFAMVMNTAEARLQTSAFGAFYFAMNNTELEGTGTRPMERPGRPLRGAIAMNHPEFWAFAPPEFSTWVFAQELGHHWLARVRIDLGEGPESTLLGRDRSHWSYYLNTGNSPMEGNAWIDHGDGTFSTQPELGFGPFCELDLYLMGLITPDEVQPFWLIEPDADIPQVEAPPDVLAAFSSTTVFGERIDLTVDDVIAAEGLAGPPPGEAPTDFRMLTLLLIGPDEPIPEDVANEVRALQDQWAAGWAWSTGNRSTVDFTVEPDGRAPPELPAQPLFVPRGAW